MPQLLFSNKLFTKNQGAAQKFYLPPYEPYDNINAEQRMFLEAGKRWVPYHVDLASVAAGNPPNGSEPPGPGKMHINIPEMEYVHDITSVVKIHDPPRVEIVPK
jgi:hypothetical protein